jgi:lysophospholipase L1-like esterase
MSIRVQKILVVLCCFGLLTGLARAQTASGGVKYSGGIKVLGDPFDVLVADGDSITFGVGVTTPWPSLISAPAFTVHNIGVSGANCSAARTAYQPFLQAGKRNFLFIWCGTNNIAGGQSAATTYTALSGYISAARAYASANSITSLTIITATMLSRDNPAGLDSVRAAFNTSVRTNTAGADFVIDFDSLSIGGGQLGCNGCATTSGDFGGDFIHPNNTGETGIIVPAFQAVIP